MTHSHHHDSDDNRAHDHAGHHHGHQKHAPVRAEFSIIALSGLQRLGWVLPVIITLWLLAFWAIRSAT